MLEENPSLCQSLTCCSVATRSSSLFISTIWLTGAYTRGCLAQLELKFKLASLVSQGRRLWPLHVPKICLKVGPRLFWIDFQFQAGTWSCSRVKSDEYIQVQISAWTWKSIRNKKEPNSTILGTHKDSNSYTLTHRPCKLELDLKLCVAGPTIWSTGAYTICLNWDRNGTDPPKAKQGASDEKVM